MTVGATEVGPQQFGRYTLLKPIATGGMAEVHLASFEGVAGVPKLVAIKRILAEHARDAEFVAMFMNEARIAASLHHANVVQAYDFGCEDGRYFLAMEYLRGQDIRRIVQTLARAGRRVPLEIAVAIGIGIAAGLHYLHEKCDAAGEPLGLVHRDVSPANIFLTSDGTVKLVDFGIAKAVRRAGDTRTGVLKGKVSYLSPEQCRSEQLDRRSDVFSLAIVLWELTVGRRLFEAASDLAVMNAIDGGDVPPPSRLVSRYPRELERIVTKGLACDRSRRYQTAEQMQDELEAFARAQRLAVTQGSVSSFVRSVAGDDHLTIAALDPDTELAPAPSLRAEPVGPGASGGRTRVLKPRLWPARSGRSGREIGGRPARRRGLLVALFALLAVGGGLGVWFTKGGRVERPAPAVATVAVPPSVAAPPVAVPASSMAARVPTPPPRATPAPARRSRTPRAPAASRAPMTETWSPDSALPPPP